MFFSHFLFRNGYFGPIFVIFHFGIAFYPINRVKTTQNRTKIPYFASQGPRIQRFQLLSDNHAEI